MKKLVYTLLIALPLGLQAQLYVGPGETVTVLSGTDVFFAGVEVDNGGTPGTLTIQGTGLTATNVVINGDVLGDDRINFDGPITNLNLDNGTWTAEWNAPNFDEVLFDLIIGANGEVFVPAGNTLTLVGDLDNGNGITLEAGTAGYGQILVNTVTDYGILTAQQYLTANAVNGWRQLCSPVQTTLADINDDITLKHAASGATPQQYNVFWYDASPIGNTSPGSAGPNPVNPLLAVANDGTYHSPANAKHWTVAPDLTQAIGPANNARAWNIFAGGTRGPLQNAVPGLIEVSGTVWTNQNYTFDCYTTHDVIFEAGTLPTSTNMTEITGWNNIPNPYPTNLSISAILGDADFDANFTYQAIHIWSPANGPLDLQQYVAVTDNAESFVNWNTGGGKVGETQNIAPFQSFWVKTVRDPTTGSTSGPDATLTLKTTMRTIDDNYNVFKAAPPMIRLRMLDLGKDGYEDQAVIAFDPLSTEDIDRNDAYKFISPNEWVPSLYTTTKGSKLALNRLPNPDPAYSIPLYAESKKNGESYSLEMRDENIDPAWTIYLEDVKTGTMHNLRNGIYTYKHDASMKINRFVVHINKMPGNIDPNSWNNVNIYANADGINVAFANPDVATADVIISNLAGQVLFQGTVSTGRVFTYPVNDDVALYAIQVITGQKVTHEKVVK